MVAHVTGYHAGLVDRTIIIRKIIATDDEVMAWWTGEGVAVGDHGGYVAPIDRLFGHAFSFFTITSGKISRYRYFVHLDYDPPFSLDTTPAEDIPAPLGAVGSK